MVYRVLPKAQELVYADNKYMSEELANLPESLETIDQPRPDTRDFKYGSNYRIFRKIVRNWNTKI